MEFYCHNCVALYSKIFYMWFYYFSTYTILAAILWFLYGNISGIILWFYYPSLEATSMSCQNRDFDNLGLEVEDDEIVAWSINLWKLQFNPQALEKSHFGPWSEFQVSRKNWG